MCGIIGSIGSPKNPAVSHALMTSLLAKTEIRGDDATGFWGVERGEGATFFTKEPKRSTEFIKDNEVWAQWKDRDIDLMIAHCRKRTFHNGTENVNKNNHPFVSGDLNTALVHNGNVPEFDALKSGYDIESDCDSEILLRMLQTGEQYDEKYLRTELAKLRVDEKRKIEDLAENEPVPQWAPRLLGLRDIFARVNYGAMAVCIGERWDDGTRALWMFRDKERPLHVIDMRPSLGQVFVTSTAPIWRDGVESCDSAKPFVQANTPIIEFPQNYIWLITYDLTGKFMSHKWKIDKTRRETTWEKERPPRNVVTKKRQRPKSLITNLNLDNYDVIKPKTETTTPAPVTAPDGEEFVPLGMMGPTQSDIKKNSTTNNGVHRSPISAHKPFAGHLGGCLNGHRHETTSVIDVPIYNEVRRSANGVQKKKESQACSLTEVPSDLEIPEGDNWECIPTARSLAKSGIHEVKVYKPLRSQQLSFREINQIEEKVKATKLALDDVATMVSTLINEGSMSKREFEEMVELLEDFNKDLKTRRCLLERMQVA